MRKHNNNKNMRDFDEIFDRGKRREGDFNKKRNSKKGDFGNRERPRMYEAICDNCGKKCEIPFKPMTDKPVYCSSCYSEREGGDRRNRKSNERHRFEEKRMFSATCSKCGKKFELPFKPTGERNVYCNDCFKGDGNNPTTKDSTNQCNKEQMEALGKKLDKIIELLTPKAIEKDIPVEAKEKKVKEKKEVKKKAATKKK